jgi:hypothetical protein
MQETPSYLYLHNVQVTGLNSIQHRIRHFLAHGINLLSSAWPCLFHCLMAPKQTYSSSRNGAAPNVVAQLHPTALIRLVG